MIVLISGGAGFIGSHIAEKMLENHHRVVVVDNFSTGSMSNLKEAIDKYGNLLRIEDCDITDLNALRKVMGDTRPQYVIHLAAQAAITTSLNSPLFDLSVNAGGMLNVIEAAQEVGVKRIIYSSTSAVYKDSLKRLKEGYPMLPSSPYGISKLAAEHYLMWKCQDYVILRFGNVYGPRQVPIGENQVVPRMIRHFVYGDKFFIFGTGKQTRDFVYVGDVAHAALCALTGKKGIYNISGGESISVNTIAAVLEELYDVKGYQWEYAPAREERERVLMDNSAALSGLSWRPAVNIREGLKATIAWWKKRQDDQSLHIA